MVYYGPWQDSRIHEEVFNLKNSELTDTAHDLLSDTPTVRSGWDADLLAALGWNAIGGGAGTYEQALDNPPEAKSELSAAAFQAARADIVGASGGTLQHQMVQTGDQAFLTPPPRWQQEQQWDFGGTGYRLWFDPDLNDSTGSALYAVPVGMDPFTDDYFVELETLGVSRPVELVDATVIGTGVGDYGLHVKDAHPVLALPFLRSAVAQGGNATSVNGALGFPSADTDMSLDHEVLNDLAENGTPYVGDWSLDGRMPTMSVLYDGSAPTSATLNGDIGVDELFEGLSVQIRLRYRWPRWRQVFYEDPTIPYRRTYPRDDALAGGAARTWPPSRAVQSSNRTFGGYL